MFTTNSIFNGWKLKQCKYVWGIIKYLKAI